MEKYEKNYQAKEEVGVVKRFSTSFSLDNGEESLRKCISDIL